VIFEPKYSRKQLPVGIVIRCYNRPEYLSRLLDSLLVSDFNQCREKILYDDGSEYDKMNFVFERFKNAGFKIIRAKNEGNEKSMTYALNSFSKTPKYICYLDDDCVVSENVIYKLLKTFFTIKKHTKNPLDKVLLSGFNCVPPNCMHQIVSQVTKTKCKFAEKNTIGGISMFFHSDLKSFVGSAWEERMDFGVCEKLINSGGHIYVTIPSVVQHIGIDGQNSINGRYDFATDFNYYKNS
jgi:glycosyltransferase involved in cell wall biosynthesis